MGLWSVFHTGRGPFSTVGPIYAGWWEAVPDVGKAQDSVMDEQWRTRWLRLGGQDAAPV